MLNFLAVPYDISIYFSLQKTNYLEKYLTEKLLR